MAQGFGGSLTLPEMGNFKPELFIAEKTKRHQMVKRINGKETLVLISSWIGFDFNQEVNLFSTLSNLTRNYSLTEGV